MADEANGNGIQVHPDMHETAEDYGELTLHICQEIPELILHQVARGIGPEWEKLARALDFNEGEVTRMREDFSSSESPALEFLTTWKQRQDGKEDSFTKLIDALETIDKSVIAHKALKNNSAAFRSPRRKSKAVTNADTDTLQISRSTPERHLSEQLGDERRGSKEVKLCKKLTEGLSDENRLYTRHQQPYISLGYFDNRGGSLSLEKYDARLIIPPGAIPAGPPKMVYLFTSPSPVTIEGLESIEISLSSVIQCGPEGLTFEESVVLTFPHHAAITREVAPEIRMRHNDSSPGKWEEFDGNIALMNETHAILLVNHFTEFTAVGVVSPQSTKRLSVGAFGKRVEKGIERYTLRVYVWEDTPAVKESVLAKEKAEGAIPLDDFRQFEVAWSAGHLLVKLSNLAGSWNMRTRTVQIINQEAIWKQPWTSRTFHFKAPGFLWRLLLGRDLFCDVDIYQGHERADSLKTSLSVYPENATAPARVPRDDVRAEVGAEFRRQAHGVDNIIGYTGCYGLPEQKLMDLCEHLDADREDGRNWIALAEWFTSKGYRFIRK
ncbi:netrin receptor UNC5B-b-like, partial [Acanthaster planci]|uniref:Netrin receptor UNC5 n=1 Tax=Acanthaster planci TaxID=133434 RepID=A0A8B8A198_ACAPL